MIKTYECTYNEYEGKAVFKVDTTKFTKEHALSTLEFFLWDYDKDANPITEVIKKYSLEAIKEATFNNYNLEGVINAFKDKEGFGNIDGSIGLELTMVYGYDFDEDGLELTIK